jgi:transcriptional regulator with XRE-family HTH domain
MAKEKDPNAIELGRRIQALRTAMGLDVPELAHRIEMSDGTIKMIESGHNFPSVPALKKLSSALGASPGELLDDDDLPTPAPPPTPKPTLADAARLVAALEHSTPLQAAIALAILTKDVSHLDSFSDLPPSLKRLLESL